MLKRRKKIIVAALLSVSVLLSACGTSGAPTTQKEEAVNDTVNLENRQNDYRGGIIRTLSLKDAVLNIMEGMKRNNILIRADNPNSFWTTSGYQDFVATFLTSPIINDTQWFNEEQTDFDRAETQMFSVENSFTEKGDEGYVKKYKSSDAIRNEKDDYSITGLTGSLTYNQTMKFSDTEQYTGPMVYRILYDCDKDWCKSYSMLTVNGTDVPFLTAEMFEYARINDYTFAIQTATERLLIVLDKVENDTDITQRTVKEFYYSRLSGGVRTTFTPYTPLEETDEDGRTIKENVEKNKTRAKYVLINELGEVATQYGYLNSMFLRADIDNLDYKWVFEDGALQQAIIYKDKTLVVTTFNKLSEKYERFIYSVDKINQELIAETEKMVNIAGLIGIVEVKSTEVKEPTEETDTPVTSVTSQAVPNETVTTVLSESDTLQITDIETFSTSATTTDISTADSISADTTTTPDETTPPVTTTIDETTTTSAETTSIAAQTNMGVE